MAHLPADSPYRLTESPSLVAELAALWHRSGAAATRPVEDRVQAAA
jgi:hypothetical protein